MNGAELADLGNNFDLQGAVFHGHWQLCQFLLEHGADANFAQSDTGERLLHAALCQSNRITCDYIVKILLEYGADLNCTTTPGMESGGFMRDVRTKGETPMHRAAAVGTKHSIHLLSEAGAKLDVKDSSGDTPLSWASWHGRPTFILDMLCFGEHSIHPIAVKQSRENNHHGWSNLDRNLMGYPTFD